MVEKNETPEFRGKFDPKYGQAVEIAPLVARLTANNPSPFTFHGTNTYLLGDKSVAVIDPGPPDDAHYDALIAAIAGREVSHIIVTHTHMDHSPLARRLAQDTGAPIYAEGPHRPARPLKIGEVNPLDASADMDFVPDVTLSDAARLVGGRVGTRHPYDPRPHGQSRVIFAFGNGPVVFRRPCDGLGHQHRRAAGRGDGRLHGLPRRVAGPDAGTYLPGHGGRVLEAHRFVRALKSHRRMREIAGLDQIRKGVVTIPKWSRSSTAKPTSACTRRPDCPSSPTWKTWWRAAR